LMGITMRPLKRRYVLIMENNKETRSAIRVMASVAVVATALFVGHGCGGSGGGGGGDDKIDTYQAVVIDDLNGDGALDIVFGYDEVEFGVDTEIKSFAVVFLQDPGTPGRFPKRNAWRVKKEALSVDTGDLDNDGIVDIAVAQSKVKSIAVLRQDPGTPGEFLPVREISVTKPQQALVIVDLDGDGLDDIAGAGDESSLLFNSPAAPGQSFTERLIAVKAIDIDSADVDMDGRVDLVLVTREEAIVMLQDPLPAAPGQFSNQTTWDAGPEPKGVSIGDLNGDNLPDLAVAGREADNRGNVHVLLQEPLVPGSFPTAVKYATGDHGVDVAIGDLNADNLPDLAVAHVSGGPGGVSLLLQDVLLPGTFHAAIEYKGTEGPNGVAIADLNADGFSDLAVADWHDTHDLVPYLRLQDPTSPGVLGLRLPLPNQ
jgi:hypothetical protein